MSETNTTPEPPLPPAVRRMAEAADRLHQEASTQVQLVEEPAGVSGEGESAGAGNDGTAQATTVVDTSAAQASAQAPAADGPARDAAYWEQRFRTLQGKYDVEVPGLQGQLRFAQGQVVALQGEVADLRTRASHAGSGSGSGTVNGASTAPAPTIAAEDVEAYGQDFIDKVRAWSGAGAAGQAELARLQAEMDGLKSQLSTGSAEQRKQSVQAALEHAVPGWREQNNDPGFINWLAQADPFSGASRQSMLNEAYSNGDANRTIVFFQAYLAEHTATQAAGATPAQTPAPGAGAVSLLDLAAPGRGRPASPGAPTDKRIWTHAQIQAFYRDVSQGKYRNNDATRARLEADIFAAPTEGRLH